MAAAPDSTEDDTTRERHSAPQVRAYLFIVLHCDRPLAGGSRHDLTEVNTVFVGRGVERSAERTPHGPSHRLDLRLPGGTVSAVHARLERSEAGWIVVDQGSRNGTFVNGERVARAVLCDGDVVEIGATLLIYRAGLPSASAAHGGDPPDLDSAVLAQLTPGLATLLPQIAEPLAVLERIARMPIPVLLLGGSGTGKEVLARCVHT